MIHEKMLIDDIYIIIIYSFKYIFLFPKRWLSYPKPPIIHSPFVYSIHLVQISGPRVELHIQHEVGLAIPNLYSFIFVLSACW